MSIVIFIVFAVMFANMAIKTVDRQIISSSVSRVVDLEPPTINIQTSQQSNFMFIIYVAGFDLTNPYFRLFNITLAQRYWGPGFTLINQTYVPL